jgi:hypothetical protein
MALFTYTGPDLPVRAGSTPHPILTDRLVHVDEAGVQQWARAHQRTLIPVRLYQSATYDVMLPARHLRPHHEEE